MEKRGQGQAKKRSFFCPILEDRFHDMTMPNLKTFEQKKIRQ